MSYKFSIAYLLPFETDGLTLELCYLYDNSHCMLDQVYNSCDIPNPDAWVVLQLSFILPWACCH